MFRVDLADQTTAVAIIEAVVLIRRAHVIAVEKRLVRGALGREAEPPWAIRIKLAVRQQIAAVFAIAELDVAFEIAVAVSIKVAELALVGIAAARHDCAVGEPSPPLQVQQRRDPGVDLRADQPVLGRRRDVQIGHLDGDAATLVIVDDRHQEARGPLHRGIGVGEEGRVEDGHRPDVEDGVAIQDRAQLLVLRHLFRLDRDGRRLGTAVVTDGAGGEASVVQFANVLAATHSRCGHQTGAIGQTRGEIHGDAGLQIFIQLETAGVDHGAIGRDGFDAAFGRRRTGVQIIGQVLAAQHMAARADIGAVLGRAADDDIVAFATRIVGIDIDRFGRQAVGRRGCGWRGRLRPCRRRQGRAGDQGRTGEKPCFESVEAPITLHRPSVV